MQTNTKTDNSTTALPPHTVPTSCSQAAGSTVHTPRSTNYGSFNEKETSHLKKRATQKQSETKKRQLAVELHRQNTKIREVAEMTSVTKSTVGRPAKILRQRNAEQLHAYTYTFLTMPGRESVLTAIEEKILSEQIICAASRGFSVNEDMIKTLMAKISSDGLPGWKNGIPSADAIRFFRARHRELTYRNHEDKDNARLKGENYYHTETFFRCYAASKFRIRAY